MRTDRVFARPLDHTSECPTTTMRRGRRREKKLPTGFRTFRRACIAEREGAVPGEVAPVEMLRAARHTTKATASPTGPPASPPCVRSSRCHRRRISPKRRSNGYTARGWLCARAVRCGGRVAVWRKDDRNSQLPPVVQESRAPLPPGSESRSGRARRSSGGPCVRRDVTAHSRQKNGPAE
jgi:hypothetical protein